MTTTLIIICLISLLGCCCYLGLEVRELNAAVGRIRTDYNARFEYLRHDGCHGWTTRDLLKDFRALCDYLGVKPHTRRDISPVEMRKDPRMEEPEND